MCICGTQWGWLPNWENNFILGIYIFYSNQNTELKSFIFSWMGVVNKFWSIMLDTKSVSYSIADNSRQRWTRRLQRCCLREEHKDKGCRRSMWDEHLKGSGNWWLWVRQDSSHRVQGKICNTNTLCIMFKDNELVDLWSSLFSINNSQFHNI